MPVDQQRRAEFTEDRLEAISARLSREAELQKATKQAKPNPIEKLIAAAIRNISRNNARSA